MYVPLHRTSSVPEDLAVQAALKPDPGMLACTPVLHRVLYTIVVFIWFPNRMSRTPAAFLHKPRTIYIYKACIRLHEPTALSRPVVSSSGFVNKINKIKYGRNVCFETDGWDWWLSYVYTTSDTGIVF